MKKNHLPLREIELRINRLPELFNSMDPTPFHHRRLDKDAEDFLESIALTFPQNSRFKITIHIEENVDENSTSIASEAIHNYFEYKTGQAVRKLEQVLHEGRVCLLIGLVFLSICLLIADLLVANFAENTFLKLLTESLLIGGWVAMWRPMHIFLYGWWPITRTVKIYRNLSKAKISVTPTKNFHHFDERMKTM